MNTATPILISVFVKQFYRENAGSFLFFIIVMFLCVGPLNGAGLIEYHYSLMRGMLYSPQFLGIVFLLWLLYSRKCSAQLTRRITDPQYLFTHLLNSCKRKKRFLWLLLIQSLLFAPVMVYGFVFAGVALYQHYLISAMVTLFYLFLLCVAPAAWSVYRWQYLEPKKTVNWLKMPRIMSIRQAMAAFYPVILIRFMLKQQWILAGIKIFTCGILYGMVLNNSQTDSELSFPFLFFNFGLLANGILIYRMRLFEELYLSFYRTLPQQLVWRWVGYVFVCSCLLIPEWITIVLLTPAHLSWEEARNFALCAWSVVLVLNSISFLDDFSMKGYLRVVLVLMCAEYFFVIAERLDLLYLAMFLLAGVVFFCSYYSFERSKGQIAG